LAGKRESAERDENIYAGVDKLLNHAAFYYCGALWSIHHLTKSTESPSVANGESRMV
jgi:hypothetical protein